MVSKGSEKTIQTGGKMTYDNNKKLRLLFLLNIAVNASDHDPREGVELPAGPVLDGALPQVTSVRLHRRVGDHLWSYTPGMV